MKYDIVILGSGESGVGAAILASTKGLSVFVSDYGLIKPEHKSELQKYSIEFEEGKHSEEIILQAKEVIKSPGISSEVAIVQKVKQAGISIMSEVEFAYRYKGDSRIVAITGSNGKTTTTNLVYHIFKTAGKDSAMVGNVGYSFARQVALDPKEWYIVEVSSFQLDDIITFKPNIAILLNITPDHLDRYQYRFENYVASKFRIALNQTSQDHFIINADDEAINNYLPQLNTNPKIYRFTMKNPEQNSNAYLFNDGENRTVTMAINADGELLAIPVNEINIKGKHNIANSMASGISAKIADIRNEKIKEALATFQSIEHRLENVGSIKGVEFINDSKATNINSVWFALESIEKPIVLILGGFDKGNDYSEIEELVSNKVKAIVCLGVDNTRIHEAFDKLKIPIIDTNTMKDAVQKSFECATSGDVVLLSPACASFDLFKNYEDRGLQFKKCVIEL